VAPDPEDDTGSDEADTGVDAGNTDPNDTGTTTEDVSSDTSVADTGGDTGDTEGDVGDTDTSDTMKMSSCQDATDLGMLDPTKESPITKTQTVEFSPDSGDDVQNDVCSDMGTHDEIYTFQIASAQSNTRPKIDIAIKNRTELNYELYRGSCKSGDTRPDTWQCNGEDESGIDVEAGVPYYLVFESPLARASFDLELTARREEGKCKIGATRCKQGTTATLEKCSMGQSGNREWREFNCATVCSTSQNYGGTDVCEGATCDAPLSASAGASINFINKWETTYQFKDFDQYDSCGPGGGGLQSPGKEIIVELQDMSSGQTVRAEVQTSEDVGFFVLPKSACNDNGGKGRCQTGAQKKRCCAASDGTDLQSSNGESFEWTAKKNDDFYLVIDKRNTQISSDEVTINLDFPSN
jgi:hypothetical protein